MKVRSDTALLSQTIANNTNIAQALSSGAEAQTIRQASKSKMGSSDGTGKVRVEGKGKEMVK